MLWICIVFVIRNNVKKYGYFRNLMFYLQRVTGIITLIFIAWHVWQTRLQVAIAGAEVNYQMMEQILTQPFYFWFYIVSILAVVFHLANGLWRSEEHTSELQSRGHLVCRLLLEIK